MIAFRCISCGHYVPGKNAGENLLPRSCPGCGRLDHWEVLAQCTPERLKELNINPTDVEEYIPTLTTHQQRVSQMIRRDVQDGIRGKDLS